MAAPASSSKLFSPLHIGPYTLSSRIVMAPLTRFRADDAHVPLPMVKDYYAQRACVPGTLQISEATLISPRAGGQANVPGIWNDTQIKAWKEVVDRVHAGGGIIFLQLWALGRSADAACRDREGTGPVTGPSAVPMAEDATVPTPLTESEIWEIVHDYAAAARNAVDGAGFDGVEIHAGSGYLVDQFLQDVSNRRTDAWGGSIEKRSRFALEVVRAVVDAVGADKTGFRVSPFSRFQGMKMADPMPQFASLVRALRQHRLAYLHLVEPRVAFIHFDESGDVEATETNDELIAIWGDTSPVMLAGGFTPQSARKAVDDKYAGSDLAIIFGRYFISNPDLVFRVRNDVELTKYDRSKFYNVGEPAGYVDYPYSDKFAAEGAGL